MGKKHISENFRLITPINATINTLMLGALGFFLAQEHFRIDRIDEKVNFSIAKISEISGYLHLADKGRTENLTNIQIVVR